MAKIRLIHWNAAESEERAAQLQEAGFEVDHSDLDGPLALNRLRENPPLAVIIDLSRVPSHGRDVGIALRSYKATRLVPLIFVGGDPEKVRRIKELLPDAVYTTWDDIILALKEAIAHPITAPVVPSSRMEAYTGAPLPKKLGIKANSVVALVNAPPGFEKKLGQVPENVNWKRQASHNSDLILWFVKSEKDFKLRIKRMANLAGDKGLWIIWPKKSSKIQSGLNQNIVRKAGLAAGLVDYKVCAVDETWSGLLFTKRRNKVK